MTEAVDRLRLLQFVLIQALLLTVCSSESDKNYVRCQNITGTVGKPLTLTCEITHEPNCNCVKYKWIKNGIELKNDTDCKLNSTLNYPIQNPSMKDNGTFTLWVQLKCGRFTELFSVVLSEAVTPPPPGYLRITPAPSGMTEPSVNNSSRNHQVVVIFVALLTILGLTGLAIFCRNHKITVSQRLNFDLCKKQNTLQGMV